MKKINIGLIGSEFISGIHARALLRLPDVKILACTSLSENLESFVHEYEIEKSFRNYKEMLEIKEIDAIVIGAPNYLHAQMAIDSARAGKHVICEKPICMNLQEADQMIEVCKNAGVKLMYCENLIFTPKYVKLKELCNIGALGDVYLLKQTEKHSGPHSAWFWDMKKSGGGVTFDMGCHTFAFFNWIYSNHELKSVYADLDTCVHVDKTSGDDNAIIIINYSEGKKALAEVSWAKVGGMDDRAEAFGSKGLSYAVLHMDIALKTYSEEGYGLAVEKASDSKGWSFTTFEEEWNYGYPQEFAHFIDCIKYDKKPIINGEDGKKILEMIFASYESARTGKKIDFPFETSASKPIDLWKKDNIAGG